MWWKPRSIPRPARCGILRYVVVHDCGRIINPMMLEGQVLGGVVHGIGATLFEWMRYDDDGQPLTVTYGDYLLPTADAVPPIEIHHMESPTRSIRSASKGRRERHHRCAGRDRLGDRGCAHPARHRDPRPTVTPARLRALIVEAQARAAASKSRERMTARPSDDLPPALTTGGSGRPEANALLNLSRTEKVKESADAA